MEIKILEGKVNSYKETDTIYVLDFGNLKKHDLAKVSIEIEGIENVTLAATCGCSAVKAAGKNRFTLQYNNTHIVEPFAKAFVLNYKEGNTNKQAQIKLKGNIIN